MLTLRAAGGGRFGGAEYKFVVNELVTGAWNVVARGYLVALGFDNAEVLAGYMLDVLSAMLVEMLEHGFENKCDNFFYILHGEVENETHLPAQVKCDIASGTHHGGTLEEGDYDRGHPGSIYAAAAPHSHSPN